MKIIIELPHDDETSGGINRMLRLAIELPFYSKSSGGVKESLKLANHLKALVRFQRLSGAYPHISNTWSVGLPNNTFPSCDVCITYSDTPYMDALVALPQVKKVLIYMLSYGMAIERERHNVLTPNVTVMCSTKKLEDAIKAEGVDVHRVGFALDMADMKDMGRERKNFLALYYSVMDIKRYDMAVEIANALYDNKIIEGVVSFGSSQDYERHKKPHGLVRHFKDADREQMAQVFNLCKCFLMPSVSEGLNLTPIESTMCGCPAIICDGAIEELFFHDVNCIIVERDNRDMMAQEIFNVIGDYENYSSAFKENMQSIVKDYTWDKVINNIMQLL